MKNRTLLTASALVLLSLTLSACGGGTTTTPPPVVNDTTPPSIVSVSPAAGATGVAKNTSVVVTFSEAMNQASAQAAFQSADLGASTISWNVDGTVMTVKPNAELVYTSSGKSYSFSVSNTATDIKGNALSTPANTSFKTFRQLSSTLPIKESAVGEVTNAFDIYNVINDIQVGDRQNNVGKRGFVGFDLSGLPADLAPANVLGAQVRMFVNSPIEGKPFTALFETCAPKVCLFQGKSMVLDHVAYGNTVVGSAYNILPIAGSDPRGLTDETPCGSGALILCLFKGTSTGWNVSDLTPWVQDDLSNRAARGNLTEMRLSFPKDTNGDNIRDIVSISNKGNRPQLIVTYLMP